MVWYLDEPQADPAPLYIRTISKAAREKGIKVMMSGAGGDDIFTGYRRHQAINAMHKIRFIPKPLQMLGSMAVKTCAHGPLKRRLQKLHYMLATGIEESLINAYHYTTPNVLYSLLTPDMREKLANRTADHFRKCFRIE